MAAKFKGRAKNILVFCGSQEQSQAPGRPYMALFEEGKYYISLFTKSKSNPVEETKL